jgi:hypothetical protein
LSMCCENGLMKLDTHTTRLVYRRFHPTLMKMADWHDDKKCPVFFSFFFFPLSPH